MKELFCYYVGQADYNFKGEVDDSWSLMEADDLDEAQHFAWEDASQYAESYEEWDGEDEEWCDFVERVMSYCVVSYDPTDPDHAALKGYVERRPEHLEHLKKVYEAQLETLAVRAQREHEKLAELLENHKATLVRLEDERKAYEKKLEALINP